MFHNACNVRIFGLATIGLDTEASDLNILMTLPEHHQLSGLKALGDEPNLNRGKLEGEAVLSVGRTN